MGLFDDIKEGKPSTIIIIILGILVFHLYWTRQTKEPMADVGNLDQIKEAVKQVYMADVEAIRNLSNVAKQLQTDGLTVPAHMNIKGKINVGSDANAKDFPEWLGLSVENPGDSHIRLKTKADDNKNVYLINRDGNFKLHAHGVGDMFGMNHDGTITASGKVVTPNGHTFECAGRQHMSGGELLYLLHKSGVVIGKEWGGNGNLQVQGGLTVSGRDILGEIDALKAQTVKYNDIINITTTGTGNHEGHGKYLGFCGSGGGGCGLVNAILSNEKSRGVLRIEKN